MRASTDAREHMTMSRIQTLPGNDPPTAGSGGPPCCCHATHTSRASLEHARAVGSQHNHDRWAAGTTTTAGQRGIYGSSEIRTSSATFAAAAVAVAAASVDSAPTSEPAASGAES
eukprot:TRINITY_DN33701_c0_g1_i1.p1 TRINITY_DN33701_c0_g1~~TRINITY_DN33701_c0_g1_i1.p1  ORF type:complete len:115 (+),score=10.24 TRINITY_DN33701_c0_g1_i1:128-472(+)